MGFLIFAYMKQKTRRDIDRKQYQLTLIANKLTTIQDQISMMQQNKNSIQSIWDSYANLEKSAIAAKYQLPLDDMNKLLTDAKKGTDANSKATVDALTKQLQDSSTTAYQNIQSDYQMLALKNNLATSLFTAYDEANLASLQRQETQMSSEKESYESQLKILNQQYESYEKGETEEAKKSAPNFGL